MSTRTWKDWYYVRTKRQLGWALRRARQLAALDHPDTPDDAMLTPHIKEAYGGWDVMVIGKPRRG